MISTGFDGPKGLSEDGTVPQTRMQSAAATQDRVKRLIDADSMGRARRRALVKGLVDGNPPYRPADLRAAGRSDNCNVNWRQSEAYLNSSIGAFYDVFSEVPTYATIELDQKDPSKRREWSSIVTDEFHRLISNDKSWDYTMQNSQFEMVLYGIGPLVFEDEFDWRCVSTQCKDLLVPDYAKSDITSWEEAAIMTSYLPHQLFEKIRNESLAADVGWNVKAVKNAIIMAHPKSQEGGQYYTWEWHQQQLKTQSYAYSAESNVIQVTHYYLREFPDSDGESKISHVIVVSPLSDFQHPEFLYKRIGRYNKWESIIHPMYYDNLGGGLHHSVSGMGTKMYSALEFQNRLICQLADQAFAPKIMFKPTTANNEQKFSLIRLGNYARLPAGFDMVQQPTMGLLEEGMTFSRQIDLLVTSNLSQYRQNVQKIEGNPLTATEVQQRASEQARLGKTQLNRYYNQLDWLYAEKYRRAVESRNASLPGGKEAKEFQDRCQKRGVPVEALRKTDYVKATRIVGQGSEFLRVASLESLLVMLPRLPESGGENLLSDYIASRAGQNMVLRYFPKPDPNNSPDDQLVTAMNQVASAKVGVPPVVTDTQRHILFAGTFLAAAADAVAALQDGANPADVLGFLDTIGPAILRHIQYLQSDPSRKDVVKKFTEQYSQLAQIADKLKEKIAQQQQQGQEQAAQTQAMMGDEQRKTFQMQREQARADDEHNQEMRRRNQKIQQQVASKDVLLAQKIRQMTQEMRLKEIEAQSEQTEEAETT